MRSRANRETSPSSARGASTQLFLQRGQILSREDGAYPVMRASQKPMHDLDARRAVVQGGERIDEALSTVVALNERR